MIVPPKSHDFLFNPPTIGLRVGDFSRGNIGILTFRQRRLYLTKNSISKFKSFQRVRKNTRINKKRRKLNFWRKVFKIYIRSVQKRKKCKIYHFQAYNFHNTKRVLTWATYSTTNNIWFDCFNFDATQTPLFQPSIILTFIVAPDLLESIRESWILSYLLHLHHLVLWIHMCESTTFNVSFEQLDLIKQHSSFWGEFPWCSNRYIVGSYETN